MRRNNSYFKPRSIRKTESKIKKNLIISVIAGIVFLFFLVTWGLPVLIGGLSIFNKFKPVEQQTALDEAIAPPVLNIPFESTSSADLKITGYSSPNSKVEIYIDNDLQTSAQTEIDGTFVTFIELRLGNNNINGRTILENGKKSLPSKTIRLFYSNEKPKLEVIEPVDNLELKSGDKKINVSGNTDPLSSITVNGVTVIVNNDGNFSTSSNLNDGENIITIISTNQVGNATQVQRKVTFVPG